MKKAAKLETLKQLKVRHSHVKKVALKNDKGRILRVEIACTMQGEDCTKTREIATQDIFQVQRCEACQREFAKIRRRKTPTE